MFVVGNTYSASGSFPLGLLFTGHTEGEALGSSLGGL